MNRFPRDMTTIIPPPLLYDHLPELFAKNEAEDGRYEFRIDRDTKNMVLLSQLEERTPRLSIRGVITDSTADYVRKSFSVLGLRNRDRDPTGKTRMGVELELTTPGGLVTSSLGIMDRIWNSAKDGYFVFGNISEYGFSGGAMILQACHRRTMSENAQIMVHFCNSVMFITEHSLEPSRVKRVQADMKRHNDHIVRFISKRIAVMRTEKTEAEWEKEMRKLFVKERFLYPDEALHYGLIDGIDENFPEELKPSAKKKSKEEKKQES
jgi:ATP-dependent protease ClpP protease subunit